MTMLENALKYASNGWYVFPLVPREKRPLTSHGLKDATLDESSIRGWWVRWPKANIGLACGPSGLCVVDLDPRNGKVEIELPPTLCCATGGGGWHYYYFCVTRSCKPLPGLDIKSDGGYVILPPSIHPSGRPYRWANDLPTAPTPDFIRAMAEPKKREPGPVVPLVASSAYVAAAIRGECDAVAQAAEGTRNTTLYNAALKLATLGIPESDIEAALVAASQLPERETLRTIQSGIAYGREHPRAKAGELSGTVQRGQPLVVGQARQDLPSLTFSGTWRPEWTEQVKAGEPEMVIVALPGRAGVELANHLNAQGVRAYLSQT